LVDDYGGYKALFAAARAHPEPQRLLEPCIELACLAHARRKFFDLFQTSQSPIAQEALNRIATLYAVEAEARDLSTAERKQLRTEKSLPTLAALHDWLQQTRQCTAPNTATSKAIDYSLKRWAALTRYAETGDLPIDNNPAENCIRPIALGKNYLFALGRRAAFGRLCLLWRSATVAVGYKRVVIGNNFKIVPRRVPRNVNFPLLPKKLYKLFI
jgi:hypothetical protein